MGGFGPLAYSGLQSSVGADPFGGASMEEYKRRLDDDLMQQKNASDERIQAAQEAAQQRIIAAQRQAQQELAAFQSQVSQMQAGIQNAQAMLATFGSEAATAADRARAGQGRAAQSGSLRSQLAWYGGQAKGGRIPPPPGARAPIEGTVVSRR